MLSKTIISIFCVTAVLITAMCMHIDGILLSAGIAIIAGLGGFTVGKTKSS